MHTVSLFNAYVFKKEVKNTREGKKVVNLSVYVKEYNPNSKNEDKKDLLWFQVNVWGKSADYVDNYIQPETHVNIQGKLQENFYLNREGKEVKIYSIYCQEIQPAFQDKKQNDNQTNVQYKKPVQNQYKNQQDDFEDDDIPF